MSAFSDASQEPLSDPSHLRNAVARFDRVEGVAHAERDRAWKRITRAAQEFGVGNRRLRLVRAFRTQQGIKTLTASAETLAKGG